MKTLDDFVRILTRVSYRPGWSIYFTMGEQPWLQVRFPAVDAVRGGEPIPHHGRKWLLSPHMTDSEVVSTAFAACLAAEEHECREHFTYRGQRVFGPHNDVTRVGELLACGSLDTDARKELQP